MQMKQLTRINVQNLQVAHAAQYQKNKQPNPKTGRRPKQTFLQRRYTDCQQTSVQIILAAPLEKGEQRLRKGTRRDRVGTSLADQWLRPYASTAGDMSLIPGWGTKILHATQHCQKKKKKKKRDRVDCGRLEGLEESDIELSEN